MLQLVDGNMSIYSDISEPRSEGVNNHDNILNIKQYLIHHKSDDIL